MQLILHIPHASINIPIKDGYVVSEQSLNDEMLKLTDWYTDDLFHSENDVMIKANFSRIFCDPERFVDDSQEVMAQFGMGVLYEKTDTGKELRKITPILRELILNDYYWKHHKKLEDAVSLQLYNDGSSLIVDGHSFPDTPLFRDLHQDSNRPDFNIGTDAFHTPKKMIDSSIQFFKEKGYSLGIDSPYAGTIVPLKYYQKNKNVNSMMLEINRKLYLKENTNIKSENYIEIKKVISEFLQILRENK